MTDHTCGVDLLQTPETIVPFRFRSHDQTWLQRRLGDEVTRAGEKRDEMRKSDRLQQL
ncbi:hypothetical protein ACKFKG_07205 [Phormidesmis sp. 146-35]